MIDKIRDLGTPLLVMLGVLVAAQLTLMVLALVSLSRTPSERLRGPKVLWILVIVFGELVGPIVFFAIARLPRVTDVIGAPQTDVREKAESTADLLYGGSERGGS